MPKDWPQTESKANAQRERDTHTDRQTERERERERERGSRDTLQGGTFWQERREKNFGTLLLVLPRASERALLAMYLCMYLCML